MGLCLFSDTLHTSCSSLWTLCTHATVIVVTTIDVANVTLLAVDMVLFWAWLFQCDLVLPRDDGGKVCYVILRAAFESGRDPPGRLCPNSPAWNRTRLDKRSPKLGCESVFPVGLCQAVPLPGSEIVQAHRPTGGGAAQPTKICNEGPRATLLSHCCKAQKTSATARYGRSILV
jgi:hypothetical protein